MIHLSPEQARKCLDRADLITVLLKDASSHKKMATEISSALQFKISHPRALLVEEIQIPPPDYLSTFPQLMKYASSTGRRVVIRTGGLQGIHRLEDLLFALISNHVLPHPTLGDKKRDERPSFAFFVAALSALYRDHNLNEDLIRICEAAREEAAELAAAAIYESQAETLGDMERGLQAVSKVNYRHSIFSRHVSALINAHMALAEKRGVELTKADVREEAINVLKAEGFTPEAEKDFPRWREYFKAAKLDALPQSRGKRGPSRDRNG